MKILSSFLFASCFMIAFLLNSSIEAQNRVGPNGKFVTIRDVKLYYEDTEEDKYSNLNFFVICEGNEKCFPRLFFDGSKYFWICRDTPVCVTEEEAKRNPCLQTNGIF